MPNLFLNTMQNKLFKNKRESRCFRHSKNKIYLLSNIEDRHLLTENENKTKSLTFILICVRERWLVKNMWYQSDPLLPIKCSLFWYSPLHAGFCIELC